MQIKHSVLIALLAMILVGGVLLTGIVLAHSDSGARLLAPLYAVECGTASGGGYRLTSATWQIRGSADGGGYTLWQPASLATSGSGCCCDYVPLLLQNH